MLNLINNKKNVDIKVISITIIIMILIITMIGILFA